MMQIKYGIGDIVYDNLLKKHYFIYGLGWKKAHQRSYLIECFETGNRGQFSVHGMNSFWHIKKVA